MTKKEVSWEETLTTLESRIGRIPLGDRVALEDSHLERTNGDYTLFFSRKIDEPVLAGHQDALADILGLPVNLEFRQNGNGHAPVQTPVPAEPKNSIPVLQNLAELERLDMTGYDALRTSNEVMPFTVFDNNSAAAGLLQRDVVDRFPLGLSQKTRPYCLVGSVGIGKTATLENVVYQAELKRHKALAAFRASDYDTALAFAKEAVGTDAQSASELWSRARSLAESKILYESGQRIRDDYSELGKLGQSGNIDRLAILKTRFNSQHEGLDLWVIDDIQSLARGKPIGTLEWLFSKIEDMYNAGKPVIVASDKSPAQFDNFPDHTRTRFCENICNIESPTDADKERYANMKFDEMKKAGIDLTKYQQDWLPTVVKIADHYRHVNAIFKNISNNDSGQKSLLNYAQLFEQALDMIDKSKDATRSAYTIKRVLSTVATLSGLTEKDIKTSEAEMRRYKMTNELITKRTALVLASQYAPGYPQDDLGALLGYQGTPKQRESAVKGAIANSGDVYVDTSQSVDTQFHRAYERIKENLQKTPLFGKK